MWFSAQGLTSLQSGADWGCVLIELQDSLPSSCAFGRIHFLVVVELVTACFFKASRRISELEGGPSLSFKGLT